MNADPRAMAWAEHGACRGEDPDLWFPVEGEKYWPDLDTVTLARRICTDCPVFVDCHTWGLAHETEGIWAGTGPQQRRRLRRALGIQLEAIVTPLILTDPDPIDPDPDSEDHAA